MNFVNILESLCDLVLMVSGLYNHLLALEMVASTPSRLKNWRKTQILVYDCLMVNFENILESPPGIKND